MAKNLVSTRAVALTSHLVSARLLDECDLDMTLRWRNAMRQSFFDHREITPRDHIAWFKEYEKRDDDYTFIIIENKTQRPIGQIALYHITGRDAELGRLMIMDEARGRGLANAAVRMLVKSAFEDWGLESIVLYLKTENQDAFNLYHHCGFVCEKWTDQVITMRTVKIG